MVVPQARIANQRTTRAVAIAAAFLMMNIGVPVASDGAPAAPPAFSEEVGRLVDAFLASKELPEVAPAIQRDFSRALAMRLGPDADRAEHERSAALIEAALFEPDRLATEFAPMPSLPPAPGPTAPPAVPMDLTGFDQGYDALLARDAVEAPRIDYTPEIAWANTEPPQLPRTAGVPHAPIPVPDVPTLPTKRLAPGTWMPGPAGPSQEVSPVELPPVEAPTLPIDPVAVPTSSLPLPDFLAGVPTTDLGLIEEDGSWRGLDALLPMPDVYVVCTQEGTGLDCDRDPVAFGMATQVAGSSGQTATVALLDATVAGRPGWRFEVRASSGDAWAVAAYAVNTTSRDWFLLGVDGLDDGLPTGDVAMTWQRQGNPMRATTDVVSSVPSPAYGAWKARDSFEDQHPAGYARADLLIAPHKGLKWHAAGADSMRFHHTWSRACASSVEAQGTGAMDIAHATHIYPQCRDRVTADAAGGSLKATDAWTTAATMTWQSAGSQNVTLESDDGQGTTAWMGSTFATPATGGAWTMGSDKVTVDQAAGNVSWRFENPFQQRFRHAGGASGFGGEGTWHIPASGAGIRWTSPSASDSLHLSTWSQARQQEWSFAPGPSTVDAAVGPETWRVDTSASADAVAVVEFGTGIASDLPSQGFAMHSQGANSAATLNVSDLRHFSAARVATGWDLAKESAGGKTTWRLSDHQGNRLAVDIENLSVASRLYARANSIMITGSGTTDATVSYDRPPHHALAFHAQGAALPITALVLDNGLQFNGRAAAVDLSGESADFQGQLSATDSNGLRLLAGPEGADFRGAARLIHVHLEDDDVELDFTGERMRNGMRATLSPVPELSSSTTSLLFALTPSGRAPAILTEPDQWVVDADVGGASMAASGAVQEMRFDRQFNTILLDVRSHRSLPISFDVTHPAGSASGQVEPLQRGRLWWNAGAAGLDDLATVDATLAIDGVQIDAGIGYGRDRFQALFAASSIDFAHIGDRPASIRAAAADGSWLSEMSVDGGQHAVFSQGNTAAITGDARNVTARVETDWLTIAQPDEEHLIWAEQGGARTARAAVDALDGTLSLEPGTPRLVGDVSTGTFLAQLQRTGYTWSIQSSHAPTQAYETGGAWVWNSTRAGNATMVESIQGESRGLKFTDGPADVRLFHGTDGTIDWQAGPGAHAPFDLVSWDHATLAVRDAWAPGRIAFDGNWSITMPAPSGGFDYQFGPNVGWQSVSQARTDTEHRLEVHLPSVETLHLSPGKTHWVAAPNTFTYADFATQFGDTWMDIGLYGDVSDLTLLGGDTICIDAAQVNQLNARTGIAGDWLSWTLAEFFGQGMCLTAAGGEAPRIDAVGLENVNWEQAMGQIGPWAFEKQSNFGGNWSLHRNATRGALGAGWAQNLDAYVGRGDIVRPPGDHLVYVENATQSLFSIHSRTGQGGSIDIPQRGIAMDWHVDTVDPWSGRTENATVWVDAPDHEAAAIARGDLDLDVIGTHDLVMIGKGNATLMLQVGARAPRIAAPYAACFEEFIECQKECLTNPQCYKNEAELLYKSATMRLVEAGASTDAGPGFSFSAGLRAIGPEVTLGVTGTTITLSPTWLDLYNKDIPFEISSHYEKEIGGVKTKFDLELTGQKDGQRFGRGVGMFQIVKKAFVGLETHCNPGSYNTSQCNAWLDELHTNPRGALELQQMNFAGASNNRELQWNLTMRGKEFNFTGSYQKDTEAGEIRIAGAQGPMRNMSIRFTPAGSNLLGNTSEVHGLSARVGDANGTSWQGGINLTGLGGTPSLNLNLTNGNLGPIVEFEGNGTIDVTNAITADLFDGLNVDIKYALLGITDAFRIGPDETGFRIHGGGSRPSVDVQVDALLDVSYEGESTEQTDMLEDCVHLSLTAGFEIGLQLKLDSFRFSASRIEDLGFRAAGASLMVDGDYESTTMAWQDFTIGAALNPSLVIRFWEDCGDLFDVDFDILLPLGFTIKPTTIDVDFLTFTNDIEFVSVGGNTWDGNYTLLDIEFATINPMLARWPSNKMGFTRNHFTLNGAEGAQREAFLVPVPAALYELIPGDESENQAYVREFLRAAMPLINTRSGGYILGLHGDVFGSDYAVQASFHWDDGLPNVRLGEWK